MSHIHLAKTLQNAILFCLFIFLLNEKWEMQEFIFIVFLTHKINNLKKKINITPFCFLYVSHCGPLPSSAWCCQSALHITLDTLNGTLFFRYVLCFRSKCLTEVKLIHFNTSDMKEQGKKWKLRITSGNISKVVSKVPKWSHYRGHSMLILVVNNFAQEARKI